MKIIFTSILFLIFHQIVFSKDIPVIIKEKGKGDIFLNIDIGDEEFINPLQIVLFLRKFAVRQQDMITIYIDEKPKIAFNIGIANKFDESFPVDKLRILLDVL